MAIAEKCPQCGSPLPAGASEGLCPACLLRRGLESNTAPGATQISDRWTPPPAGDLESRFPEFDHFEFIGRGGMGAVYKARQKNLDRLVALKILPPEIGGEAAFAERFAREALARLNHPHIVTIHDFGRRGELFFLVMEYADGLNLRQLLATGAVSAKEALAIVPQICEALQYAHDQGIVHRDIKPENILLSRNGTVKIADFGLAKLMGRIGADAIHPDGVMGTPRYMAPEQTERPAEVDHRADIYALGVVFYQMLTGELPTGKFEPPSRKVVIDVRLDEVVLRALERLPERRYQQVSEVRTAVETIVATPIAKNQPEIKLATSRAKTARLSRTAVVGAVWAVEALLAYLWMGQLEGERVTPWQDMSGPERLGFLLTEGGWTVGILSVLGTTILGWVAISQIRRSRGSVGGLRLAFLDALWYPLLGADAIVFAVARPLFATQTIHHYPSPQKGISHVSLVTNFHTTALLLTAALCVLLDLLIVRRAWKAVQRRVSDSGTHSKVTPSHAKLGIWAFGMSAVCVALVAMAAAPVWDLVRFRVIGLRREQTNRTNERNQITAALAREIGGQLATRNMSSQFTTVDVAEGLFGATATFSDLEETTSANGADVHRHLAGKLNLLNLGDGTWHAQGDEDLQAVRFNVQVPITPADVTELVEYPSVSVTSNSPSGNGPAGPFPRPELFLAAVRLMPDYQDWLSAGTDHTFVGLNSSGYRYAAHFIGLTAPDRTGRREELIADVKLFRPDGSLLAVSYLGKAHPDHWETDVFGERSDRVATRLLWESNTADPEIEGGVLKEVIQFPGMPNEEDWLVDASRAAHALPNTRPSSAQSNLVNG
jgi:serine/threonine protein kinase